MTLPRAASDNLWRFVALFFMVATIAGGAAHHATLRRLDHERLQRDLSYAESRTLIAHATADADDLRRSAAGSQAIADATARLREARLRAEVIDGQREVWTRYEAHVREEAAHWMRLARGSLGVTLFVVLVWYWRFQRHMDRLASLSAREAGAKP